MPLGHMPYVIIASEKLKQNLGRSLPRAAETALRVLLQRRRSLEVACLQVDYNGVPIVFSSRIGAKGDIVLEMDEGDPRFASREVEEDQLRQAEIEVRERLQVEPRSRRARH